MLKGAHSARWAHDGLPDDALAVFVNRTATMLSCELYLTETLGTPRFNSLVHIRDYLHARNRKLCVFLTPYGAHANDYHEAP